MLYVNDICCVFVYVKYNRLYIKDLSKLQQGLVNFDSRIFILLLLCVYMM